MPWYNKESKIKREIEYIRNNKKLIYRRYCQNYQGIMNDRQTSCCYYVITRVSVTNNGLVLITTDLSLYNSSL
jgi:hypothetical protein